VPDYRRNRVPGGTFFFTVDLLDCRSDLLVTQIQALRDAVRQVPLHAPFRIGAWVVLPDRSLARDQDGIRESFARP
jgi:putative transposase